MSEREATLNRLREKVEEETETETEEVVEEEKEKSSSIREYIVFMSPGANPTTWKEEGRVEASSTEAALNMFATKQTDGTSFVAVASRYWQPVKAKVETKTTITFEALD